MAEADRFMFDYQEVAEALIKKQGLHEGLWGIAIEFGFAAQNMPTGPEGKTLSPGAVSLIQKIGLNRWKEPNNLTVDAAEVNPLYKHAGKAKAGKKKAVKK